MRKVFFIISIFPSAFFPFLAFAQEPTVVSFTASQTSINSGQTVSFSWTLQNAGGYTFSIPCITGITLKNADNTAFDCNTPVSTTAQVNNSLIFFIENVSGQTKNIIARLTPKSAGGIDNTSAAREVTVSVATNPQPIERFTSDTSSTLPGKPVTISWNSSLLTGVNLQIECRDGIRVSSPAYTQSSIVPCGKIIFVHDLSPSGSLELSFTNSNVSDSPYTLKLYPAMVADTSYDGSHALTLTLTISSDILPDPVITYFAASSTAVNSGENTDIHWTIEKAVGANVKFSCNPALTATSTQDTNQLFPCDALLFANPLNPSGQLSLAFRNISNVDQPITLSLIPSKTTGQYDATRAKSISLWIHPESVPMASPSGFPTPTATPNISPSPSVSPSSGVKTIFTQMLKRGSRSVQVSALQEFLKRDAGMYPEGLVTGFFGPATERAVQRFQTTYGLVSSGAPATTGYGAVGPRTREKLNLLQ